MIKVALNERVQVREPQSGILVISRLMIDGGMLT